MSETMSCPDCGDSPLSTTGNITGILTFAYALLASALVFLTVIRSADSEIHQLRASVDNTSRHIQTMYTYFSDLNLVGDQDLELIKLSIKDALDDWRAINEDLAEQSENLASMRPRIRRQLVWWYRHSDILAGMAKLQSEKDNFFALLLTYMSRCGLSYRFAHNRFFFFFFFLGANFYCGLQQAYHSNKTPSGIGETDDGEDVCKFGPSTG